MKAQKSTIDYLNDGPSRSVPLSRSVPAYLQIEEQLADRIEAGEFSPGDVLPTERELTRQLGVSRMTVRAAMDRLVQRDLIVRRQGSGTFVAEPKLRQDASKLRGFFEDTVGQGVVPVSRLLLREDVLATRHIAGVLDLSVGESVYRIVRVRSARGVPVVLERPTSRPRSSRVCWPWTSAIIDLSPDGQGVQRSPRPGAPIPGGRDGPGSDCRGPWGPSGSSVMLVERVSWDALGRAVGTPKTCTARTEAVS